jgi:hypothetical protein
LKDDQFDKYRTLGSKLGFKYGKCWFYKIRYGGIDLGRLREIVLAPDLCEHLAQQYAKKDPDQTERAFRSEYLSKYGGASNGISRHSVPSCLCQLLHNFHNQ